MQGIRGTNTQFTAGIVCSHQMVHVSCSFHIKVTVNIMYHFTVTHDAYMLGRATLLHGWVHSCGSLAFNHLLPVRMPTGLQPGQQPVSAVRDIKQASALLSPQTHSRAKALISLLFFCLDTFFLLVPALSEREGLAISDMYIFSSIHFKLLICMHWKQEVCSLDTTPQSADG